MYFYSYLNNDVREIRFNSNILEFADSKEAYKIRNLKSES